MTRVLLFLSLTASLHAQSLTVSVKGVTTTQAVISYTAPDANPCTVKVSENATLVPLVHDVDPALFAGSNSDSRPGSITNGTSRIVVIGKRDTETGADGVNYSRALQANTQHSVSVTCGTLTGAVTFTTQNIPLGMTYRDLPATLFPTVTDDLNQTIVDPHTGTLLRKVNNSAAQFKPDPAWPPYLYFGAFVRMCSTRKYNGGFLCAFPSSISTGGPATLYWISPQTGVSNYLGYITIPAQSGPNGWGATFAIAYPNIAEDGSIYTVYTDNGGHVILLKGTFVGGTAAVTGAYQAAIQWSNFTPAPNDVNAQMTAFDPTFNPSAYNGGFPGSTPPIGNYLVLTYTRGQQDTPGWAGVVDLSTDRIVAAINYESGSAMSYCGNHNFQVIGDSALVFLGTHALGGGSAWQGPFVTTLSNALDTVTATVRIAGTPADSSGRTLGGPYVGSILTFHGLNPEAVKVTSVTPGSGFIDLGVQRGYLPHIASYDDPANYLPKTHSAGETLRAECTDWTPSGDVPMYWHFLHDPHGSTLADRKVAYDYQIFGEGGHNEWSPTLELVEGYGIRTGPLILQIGQPPTYSLTDSPKFGVAQGGCFGSGCTKHPSYHAPGSQWFTDGLSWSGGAYTYPDPNGVTPISGQLYKYNFPYNDGNFPIGGQSLNRKHMPTLATTGGTELIDVSGPGSTISDQPADNGKYCIAYKAGECRPGSSAGNIFANLASLAKRTCYGSDNPDPSQVDLCIIDLPTYASTFVQFGFVPNHEGIGILPGQPDTASLAQVGNGYTRIITEGLGGPKCTGELFKALPDGSWAFFENRCGQGSPYLMMAKLPPFTKDAIRRDVFVRAPIAITPPAGAVSAEVDFGYSEFGGNCTSRNETCAAVSATVNDANPFNYTQSDTYTKASCTSSCTITIPVLPEHVAYYQVKYYDASGAFLSNGDRGVIAESSVVH